jgi:ATP dependent DNA ligase domain
MIPGASPTAASERSNWHDGEAVVLIPEGMSDFEALHSRKHDGEVQLYAFDLLALEGDDLRALPLSMRKTNLERLLDRQPNGIFAAPYEAGEIGPALYRQSCVLGLDGMVSKRRDRAYRADADHWIKVKNPAMTRAQKAHSRNRRCQLERRAQSPLGRTPATPVDGAVSAATGPETQKRPPPFRIGGSSEQFFNGAADLAVYVIERCRSLERISAIGTPGRQCPSGWCRYSTETRVLCIKRKKAPPR